MPKINFTNIYWFLFLFNYLIIKLYLDVSDDRKPLFDSWNKERGMEDILGQLWAVRKATWSVRSLRVQGRQVVAGSDMQFLRSVGLQRCHVRLWRSPSFFGAACGLDIIFQKSELIHVQNQWIINRDSNLSFSTFSFQNLSLKNKFRF